jgi:ankyrin repeat protein
MLRCAALAALLFSPTLSTSISTVDSFRNVFLPDLAKSDDLSDLLYGAALGDIGAVERAIAEGAIINGCDARGWSPLIWAANRGRPVVLNLIAAGADLDLVDATGSSAVLHAAVGGHLDIVDALIGSGANPNKGNTHGLTPLAVVLEIADDARALTLCVADGVAPAPDCCGPLRTTRPCPPLTPALFLRL